MKTPFDVLATTTLEQKDRPNGRPNWFRGRVSRIHMSGGQPAFLVDVAPLSGGVSTGAADNEVTGVAIMQAGFGSMDPGRETPPSGIVYLPEVGSLVRCEWDGSRWCITGYYTGPVKTRTETGQDAERRLVAYNPGIETSTSRSLGVPGWDLPHWSFGIEPGDALMGKEQARVKVGSKGAIIGADLDACCLYTVDGRIIERFGGRESRGVGHWEIYRWRQDGAESVRALVQNGQFAETPPEASCYHCRLMEVAPLAKSLRPYLIHQEGYVARDMLNDGRSAITTDVPRGTAVRELENRDYVVHRMAVVQPLAVNPPKPGNELDKLAYELFDHQVDADGSFRIRAGNRSQAPGAQGEAPTAQMDLSIDFDAESETLVIRLGSGGQEATKIKAVGLDPNRAQVELVTSKLEATVRDEARVEAKKLTVKATRIALEGDVSITGKLDVSKDVTATGEVSARGIKLSKHVHGGDSGGTTSAPR